MASDVAASGGTSTHIVQMRRAIMKAISSIAVAAALTAAALSPIALASAAFAGVTNSPEQCRAEQETLQTDTANNIGGAVFSSDKAALDACMSQRQMDNDGSRRDIQDFHHRS